jgi:hypothetical protein
MTKEKMKISKEDAEFLKKFKIETPEELKKELAECLKGKSLTQDIDGLHLSIYTEVLDFTISKSRRFVAYIEKKKYSAEQRGDSGYETASQSFCGISLHDFHIEYPTFYRTLVKKTKVSKGDPASVSHLLDWDLDLYRDTGIITPGLWGCSRKSKPFHSKEREICSILDVSDEGKVKYKTADGLEHILK